MEIREIIDRIAHEQAQNVFRGSFPRGSGLGFTKDDLTNVIAQAICDAIQEVERLQFPVDVTQLAEGQTAEVKDIAETMRDVLSVEIRLADDQTIVIS